MSVKSFLALALLASCSHLTTSQNHPSATDAHMHVQLLEVEDDMEFHGGRALFAADSIGINRAIVISNAYSKMSYKDHARSQNAFVAKEVAKYKRNLAGACAINPLSDWAREEIKQCHKDGLKILKLHTMASGMDLKKKSHQKILKETLNYAQQFNYTVLIHGNFPKDRRGNEAEVLLKTLEAFPRMRFIIGHLLGMEYEALTKFKHPRFLVEISAVPIWTRTSEQKERLVEVIRLVGIEKFIFGSDWPVFHPAETLKALQSLPLRSSELNSIVYLNARAIDDLFSN